MSEIRYFRCDVLHLAKKYAGLAVSEARRLKGLEQENAQLKKLLAESMLDNEALKVALNRKY
uniref:Transposase n=1 Tax=Methylophaga nitratireducenticrescens TaxID=754476 RepID=I1XGM9_METNJ